MTSPAPTALSEFARRRALAADLVDELARIIEDIEVEAHDAALLRRTADRARKGRFVVLLLGCFSSGKSTLLNALLGRPVLPVKVNPCTAILTEVVHGDAPGVEVRFRDGRTETHDVDSFLDTYQLRTAEDDAGAEAADRFGDVDRAIVRWPLPLLDDGVVLLDTPGLDDDAARTARTLSSLPDADAVIFTLSANRFLTDLERRTLERDLLPLGLSNLFFPTTMVDLLAAISDEPALELRRLRERAADVLGPLAEDRLFPLDARGALAARWDWEERVQRLDSDALATSGLPAFETELETFLVDERGRAQLAHLHGAAVRARVALHVQRQLDEATATTGIEVLRERVEELRPRFDELRRIQRRVGITTDRFVERTSALLWNDLRQTLALAEEDLPDAIAAFDLGNLAGMDLLTDRGRRRVERALGDQLDAWLTARLASWQQSLGGKLESSLADLRDELAAEAGDFDEVSAQIVADFSGLPLPLPTPALGDASEVDPAERWFSVAVGALLLSPGTVAAGWTEGYEGALKGAAGRLGVRLAILGLGALLGPIGWAGILLYAVSDAVLLFLTGGSRLTKLRQKLARDLDGKVVGIADTARDEVEAQIAAALAPLRESLVDTAGAEVTALEARLAETVATRKAQIESAASRSERWDTTMAAADGVIERLAEFTR